MHGNAHPLPATAPERRAGPRDGVCEARLADVLTGDAQVSPEEQVERVAERFFADPALDAMVLVEPESGRPVGLLTRGRLLVKLARNFGHELYARKPVTRIADLSPLVLPHDLPLPLAVERALAREAASVYDEVIAVDAAGRYMGHAAVRELAREQGAALERSDAAREAALARARDLEEVDRLRARFLAHATHELRSPVNAIVALAELLRMACARRSLADVEAKIPVLARSAAELRGTVNELLDLSKLEAGRMEVSIAPADLGALVSEVAATVRLLVGDAPVEVRADAAPGLLLETDGPKVRRILLNLGANAAKFTRAGSVRLAGAPDGRGGVLLTVADTGCGIDEADLPRLFVPFSQLEDAATRTREGTGLGLAITRSLATLLGGTVSVESRRGAGTTFTVRLPARPPTRENA
ncbi:histidine kinase [Anaeromyxobacter dehalogenans 2CP-1]|uniref:histidine kinase n=1 Tax=Anaeromyxobacter dehalogenans (strain ATCC BAA-258 / DSM 21875 / 2CP-1) TaxID=455488 RepID=B8JF38_ANAD2|nr:ATP-binding protein [Anaeromyxobacter dehalogenans]ACL64395.1 histidine kinase [Anaeromyxobacter dehalogenans 2CP-1]